MRKKHFLLTLTLLLLGSLLPLKSHAAEPNKLYLVSDWDSGEWPSNSATAVDGVYTWEDFIPQTNRFAITSSESNTWNYPYVDSTLYWYGPSSDGIDPTANNQVVRCQNSEEDWVGTKKFPNTYQWSIDKTKGYKIVFNSNNMTISVTELAGVSITYALKSKSGGTIVEFTHDNGSGVFTETVSSIPNDIYVASSNDGLYGGSYYNREITNGVPISLETISPPMMSQDYLQVPRAPLSNATVVFDSANMTLKITGTLSPLTYQVIQDSNVYDLNGPDGNGNYSVTLNTLGSGFYIKCNDFNTYSNEAENSDDSPQNGIAYSLTERSGNLSSRYFIQLENDLQSDINLLFNPSAPSLTISKVEVVPDPVEFVGFGSNTTYSITPDSYGIATLNIGKWINGWDFFINYDDDTYYLSDALVNDTWTNTTKVGNTYFTLPAQCNGKAIEFKFNTENKKIMATWTPPVASYKICEVDWPATLSAGDYVMKDVAMTEDNDIWTGSVSYTGEGSGHGTRFYLKRYLDDIEDASLGGKDEDGIGKVLVGSTTTTYDIVEFEYDDINAEGAPFEALSLGRYDLSFNPFTKKLTISSEVVEPVKLVGFDNPATPTYTVYPDNDDNATFTINKWQNGWSFNVLYDDVTYNMLNAVVNGSWVDTSSEYGGDFSLPASAVGKAVTIKFNTNSKKIFIEWSEATVWGNLKLYYTGDSDSMSDFITSAAVAPEDGVYSWKEVKLIKRDVVNPRFGFVNEVDFESNQSEKDSEAADFRIYGATENSQVVGLGSPTTVKENIPLWSSDNNKYDYSFQPFYLSAEGFYDIVFDSNSGKVTVTATDFTPVLHHLTSAQNAAHAGDANKLTKDANGYKMHFDELNAGFKLYDSRNKQYVKVADALHLSQEHEAEVQDNVHSFTMAETTYHNVDLIVSNDLSKVTLNCLHPTWTLVGSFNGWNSSDAKSEFKATKTTATEGVEHTLTLPALSGAFKIVKTGEEDLENGQHFALKNEMLGKGETVTLEKVGKQGPPAPTVDMPETMWCYNLATTEFRERSRTYGNLLIWDDVNCPNEGANEISIRSQKSKGPYYGPQTDMTYLTVGEPSQAVTYTSWLSDWLLKKGTYDLVFDFEHMTLTAYNAGGSPGRAPQRRVNAVAEGDENDDIDLRLLSGSLENLTLNFNSTTGELAIAQADPVYNLVINGTEANYTSTITRFTPVVDSDPAAYVVTVGQLKAGDKLLISVDHSKTNVYGSASGEVLPGDASQNLTAGVTTGIEVSDNKSVYNNVTITWYPETGVINLSAGTTETYELIGYYCGWWANHQVQKARYVFSKVGEGYVLTIPELAMSGTDTNNNGFKIGKFVNGELTEVYGAANASQTIDLSEGDCNISMVEESAPTITDNVLSSTGAVVMADPENDQWLNTCVLTFNPLIMANGLTLNIKGSVSTKVVDLEGDGAVADVYNALGVVVLRNAVLKDLRTLEPGVYLFAGKKYMVK